MWNGSGDGEAGRNSCACGCSVHSAAESAKDSVRLFTISGLATRLFATVRKTEGCSVDINIVKFLRLILQRNGTVGLASDEIQYYHAHV